MLKRIINKSIRTMGLGKAPVIMHPGGQNLKLYWTQEMAEILETWGEDNAWREIQYLMVNCCGKILDIACGTGRVMEILSKFPQLELYGCDISDFLLSKALEHGLDPNRLRLCDASDTKYEDNFFDYSYSIGSLEHFTEDGIVGFVAEARRITKVGSFHMIPVSRSGRDEGWITTLQSFHNNSVEWWLGRYKSAYDTVFVIDSGWHDDLSVGKWFICMGN
jgi:ubiquinone/menaquinone biosynthesis C-methylase UbiE